MWRIIVLLFLSNAFTPSTTLPQGAPESVCDTLLPFHGGGIRPLTTVSPFSIETTASAVGQGQILTVEIKSVPPELRFGGFMIHARSTSPPYKVIGRFAPSIDGLVKLINCDGVENTATHVSPIPKGDIGLQWQAPNDFLGEVVFNATIAQEYDKFWVGLESSPVQVVQRGSVIAPPGISTTRRPVTSTTPVYVPEIKPKEEATDSIYEGCGETKTCFGVPDSCVDRQNCQGMVTVQVLGEKFHFELKSNANNVQYVAVGLSLDDRMGNDAGMECIPEAGTIKAYSSWITPRPVLGATRQGVPQTIISLLNASYIDGTIYCKLERDSHTTIMGKEFDLVNGRFHLLVAIGNAVYAESVSQHTQRIASREAMNLAEVGRLRGRSVLLLRLHAAFMLTAWIGAASIGILLARYFKQTWVGSTLCGKDQWFAWHRFFMIATWSLTIVGFVIIFVEIRGWSAENNPHAILGTITTGLCFIQPFMALFRPGPTHKNRPIFNWLHWLVGNAAHLLAIITIFFAVQLTGAQLPQWFDWILVAFVAFHVVMHFIFSIFLWIQIAGCMSDKSSAQRVNSFPMTDVSPRNSVIERKKDAPNAPLRKALLAIYLIIVIGFVIATVVIAALAPIGATVRSLQSKIMN
ncbi:putative ferric-chelate reductase 1 like [Pseudolycoriella hygida]|uniref:Ferric-chelate reductase 1 like n=1 Tax=Pseudolycoriella hygida TaxID=35572 RepID=A0A9Q0MR53_9DIPT|nr:putative ferric-chelate reductase 1 like [Pseudolycoriella hygida]